MQRAAMHRCAQARNSAVHRKCHYGTLQASTNK